MRDVLKLTVALLVVLLVLAVVALTVGQRYIVYTDDGVRLELPFFHREEPAEDGSITLDVIQKPYISIPEPTRRPPDGAEITQ